MIAHLARDTTAVGSEGGLAGQPRPDDPIDDEDAAAAVARWLAAYGGPRVAVADLLCDRHTADLDRIALRHEDAAGRAGELTFVELAERSARFAGALRELGVGPGDRVATLLPKSPELLIAVLGIWRLGAVHVPLFTAFGPQAIDYRLDHSGARVVVTDCGNRPKLDDRHGNGETAPPRVVTIEGEHAGVGRQGDVPFWTVIGQAEPVESAAMISSDDPLILIYTSGTTGHPKGVVVPVRALAAIEAYMRFGLDVRPDDVYWNIADPGWAYGLYFAVVGPLLLGQTTLLVNQPFNAEATDQLWRKYGVTNFAAAPTVYRAMRAAGVPKGGREGLRLRVATSAGEPLNPEVIAWAAEALGVPLHDQYGQTEHAMFVVNAHHPALRRPLRPGSMGHPMPGFRVVVVDSEGNELGPGQAGQIAIDVAQSPLWWFPGYYRDPAWSARCYTADGRYYVSGDAATHDDDGYFTFAGRADDLINSSGYRIGPFEVESALIGHPAVAEAAVIGVPDALRGEVVEAFVVLKLGHVPTDDLAEELSRFVKAQLAAHAYPRRVVFVDALPKTPAARPNASYSAKKRRLTARQATEVVVVRGGSLLHRAIDAWLVLAAARTHGQGLALVDQLERVFAPIGSPGFQADPYPTYARLRSMGPVHRDDARPIWHVVGYHEVHAGLREARLAAARSDRFFSDDERLEFGALVRIQRDMMVFADPPRHTRLRGLVTKAFTPRVVEGLRGRVQAIVDDLLARVVPAGRLDVIADLAIPLPTTVIAELLGALGTDRDRLKAWSDDFAAFIGGPTDRAGVVRADRAVRELTAYFGQAVDRWRREPGDNLISGLIAAEERGDTLTADELLATCVILLVGGHETTTNLIGNGLLALLRHPDQLRRLRNDPALIGPAVEELLRYDSPAQMTTRLAVDDLTLGGTRIGREQLVKLWLGAGNRDPARFPEPDRLDIERPDNRHLSFGHGIHFCVGAALARLEGQVALAALVARFPNLGLTDEPLEYHGTQVFRALKRLPVVL